MRCGGRLAHEQCEYRSWASRDGHDTIAVPLGEGLGVNNMSLCRCK